MNAFQEVSTQYEMEGLLDSMSRFHDGMTKEIHVINRGAVLDDHTMVMGHQFDAQVLIQSSWEPYAVELLFIDVLQLTISDAGEYFGATGLVGIQSAATEMNVIEMKFDASFSIFSRQLFFQVRPEYLGMKARLNSEVPSPHAIPARRIGEGKWRQCSSCSDAWQEDTNQVFAVCPSCSLLTELKS